MTRKKKINHILNWIKDAWLKATFILLIAAGGFYAYAQITWPGDEPNPTTGVVGMFVGITENKYSAALGYDQVNSWCSSGNVLTLDSAQNKITSNKMLAHVCTPDEMINSYNHGNSNSQINQFFSKYGPASDYQFIWVNNGPPSFAFNANDCQGWQDIKNTSSGTAWDLKNKFGFLRDCGESAKSFACCK